MMHQVFPAFIAKASVRRVPLVGVIAAAMECVFVERETKNGGPGAAALVLERARRCATQPHCRPLLAFPEGTTSNGAYLLPFRTGAFLAGVPVQPILLRYHGTRFSPAFESIEALRSILLVLSQPWLDVEVTYLPLCTPSREEVADPTRFAERVRGEMLAAGGLHASVLTLADKRAYHDALRQRAKAE